MILPQQSSQFWGPNQKKYVFLYTDNFTEYHSQILQSKCKCIIQCLCTIYQGAFLDNWGSFAAWGRWYKSTLWREKLLVRCHYESIIWWFTIGRTYLLITKRRSQYTDHETVSTTYAKYNGEHFHEPNCFLCMKYIEGLFVLK